MKHRIKNLNWKNWSFVMILGILVAAANKNVNSFLEWLVIVICVALPISLFILFAGKS